MISRLTELAWMYSCDKLHAHSYIDSGFYEQLFKWVKVRRLLELGIGYQDLMAPFVPEYIHGASLKLWESYFPDAAIYACDIRPETLVNEGRIQSFVCDQSSPLALLELVRTTGGNWDVVIDDGSHVLSDQVVTAVTLLPHVTPGGVYVVEDCQQPEDLAKAIGGVVVRFNKRADDILVVIRK